MRQTIQGVWGLLHNRKQVNRGKSRAIRTTRLHLESLEDRVTPTVTTVAASGVIDGSVFVGGGRNALAGVNVTLTGNTTTGRTVDVNATTGANGAYSFTSVLPGTYVVSNGTPDGFVNGNNSSTPAFTLAQGQTTTGKNLGVAGLAASRVSLAFFVSGPAAGHVILPPPGSGTGFGFSLDSANPLSGVSVGRNATNFIDLSGNFFDPDTTDTTVTFNTSQGSFNVELFNKDAPQTVTNFLDYIASGAYNKDLFHRIANLSTGNTGTPQILQAGGFAVTTDNATPANVTALTALTTVFQPILSEYSAAHPNAAGTIAMALSTGVNSATNEFYFNLTDNSTTLGPANTSGPFTVFGKLVGPSDATTLGNFATNYKATDVSNTTNFPNSNAAFGSLPLSNGFTPASNFPTGATVNNLAIINSIGVTTPSNGHLTYSILSNSNPAAVTATLGTNTLGSTFSANQLKLVSTAAGGTSVITLQITDARGEVVTRSFTVTAS